MDNFFDDISGLENRAGAGQQQIENDISPPLSIKKITKKKTTPAPSSPRRVRVPITKSTKVQVEEQPQPIVNDLDDIPIVIKKKTTTKKTPIVNDILPPPIITTQTQPQPSVEKKLTYVDILNTLPEPTVILMNNSDPNERQWTSEFQSYIYNLLQIVYDNDLARKEAVSAENMTIWIRAFTDVTFDSDDSEAMETVGDAILDNAFMKYLIIQAFTKLLYQKFGRSGLNPIMITNIRGYYMSGNFQAGFAEELKMTKWVRLGGLDSATPQSLEQSLTEKVRGNMLETFFAALDMVCDNVKEKFKSERQFEIAANIPSGASASFRVLDTMFNHKGGIDFSKGRESAHSLLIHLRDLYAMRLGGIKIISPVSGSNEPYKVIMSQQLRDAIAEDGIKIPFFILSSDKLTEAEAVEEAFGKLEKLGITAEWISNKREETHFEKLEPAELREQISSRAKMMGYNKLLFAFPNSSKQDDGSVACILYGVDKRDDRMLLGMARGKDKNTAKLEAAKNFIGIS